MTAKQLARRMEVSERTILRDMDALGTAGVPVAAARGIGGGWELLEGDRTSISALTGAEVQSIFMSKPAQLLTDLGLHRAADAALIKLMSLLPSMNRPNAEMARQRIHIDISGWQGTSERVPLLPLLQDAVWRERKTKIVYDRGDSVVERILDPLGLVAKGSAWYLLAGVDSDVRVYRVARTREATMLDQTFTGPADFDLSARWEASRKEFRARLPRYEVLLRTPDATVQWLHALTRYGAVDRVEADECVGWSRVAMHFDAEDVACHSLLGFGTRVEVIEPRSLARRILEEARAIVRRGRAK